MTGTTDRPLVTFAVIAYNQERFIREAIEGAFAQTYEPLEIILSDDCSPDRTYEIMEEMAAAYTGPHKVVLNRNEPNLGLVGHVNSVMDMVSGEFIVISAGDDVSEPHRTSRITEEWQKSPSSIKLVHSSTKKIDESGNFIGYVQPPIWMQNNPSPFDIIEREGFVIGSSAAWHADTFKIFGPLHVSAFTEDRIIPFRARLLGEIIYLPEDLVQWRTGGQSYYEKNTGRTYLYGAFHRGRKWRMGTYIDVLNGYDNFDFPRKEELKKICSARIPSLAFAVDLAEANRLKRISMFPRSIRTCLQTRNLSPIKDWMRYTFDHVYVIYANWRIPRRERHQRYSAGTPERNR